MAKIPLFRAKIRLFRPFYAFYVKKGFTRLYLYVILSIIGNNPTFRDLLTVPGFQRITRHIQMQHKLKSTLLFVASSVFAVFIFNIAGACFYDRDFSTLSAHLTSISGENLFAIIFMQILMFTDGKYALKS